MLPPLNQGAGIGNKDRTLLIRQLATLRAGQLWLGLSKAAAKKVLEAVLAVDSRLAVEPNNMDALIYGMATPIRSTTNFGGTGNLDNGK